MIAKINAKLLRMWCLLSVIFAVASFTHATFANVSNSNIYTIQVKAQAHGAVTPSGNIALESGTHLSLKAKPAHGYSVQAWMVDGEKIAGAVSSYTLNSINANHKVEVFFKKGVTQPLYVSVGEDDSDDYPIYSYYAIGSSKSWHSFDSKPKQEIYLDAACAGSGNAPFCIMIGNEEILDTYDMAKLCTGRKGCVPLNFAIKIRGLSQPIDKMTDLKRTMTFTKYEAIGCSGENFENSLCAVGGHDVQFRLAVLNVTNDGFKTFIYKGDSDEIGHGTFDKISCSGDGIDGVCLASSRYDANDIAIWNGGRSLSDVTPSNHPALPYISCTGNGANAVCLGVTEYSEHYVYTRGIKDLKYVPVPLEVDKIHHATGVSCTGEGATALCMTTLSTDYESLPLLVSTDGANTFQLKKLPVEPATLFDVSCKGSGTFAVCIAIGSTRNASGEREPLILQSHDGGKMWNRIRVSSLPDSSGLDSVACVDNGAGISCVIMAYIGNGYTFLTSRDEGNTWSLHAISPVKGGRLLKLRGA